MPGINDIPFLEKRISILESKIATLPIVAPTSAPTSSIALGHFQGTDQATTPGTTLAAARYKALRSGIINYIGIHFYTVTAGSKYVLGIYADDGTLLNPGNLLAQTSEQTIVTTDLDNIAIWPFLTPVNLELGKTYWLAMMLAATKPVVFANTATARTFARQSAASYSTILPTTFAASANDWYWNLIAF